MEQNKTVIGICDDQPAVCEHLKGMILSLCKAQDLPVKLRLFYDAASLLERVSEIQILFLDIDMPKMSGLEAGSIIRKNNADCRIIMATADESGYKEAFKFDAFRYVTKPFQEEEIAEALYAALSDVTSVREIEVSKDRIPHKIRQQDILYVRAFNGYVEFQTPSGVFRRDSTLEEMEQILDPAFFCRIHRSVIVGLAWIQSYSQQEVILKGTDAVALPVARRQYATFLQSYMRYDLTFHTSVKL